MTELVCAWCGAHIEIVAWTIRAPATSHGICLACERALTKALNALPSKPPVLEDTTEWRRLLTAKFARTWKALTRFRAKVGANRFRELMAELPSTIENIGSREQRSAAEFFVLLGPENFETCVAELLEALETGSEPGAFWVKWIEVVVEQTRLRSMDRGRRRE